MSLNPKAINQLFNLSDYSHNDDYTSLFANLTDELNEKLLQEVTIPGTQWIRSKQGNLTCHREHLTMEAKVWFYFICHSLMSTGHTSSLNMEQVFLLACIVKGRSINVVQIIVDHIRACATKKSGELFFPTLICLLCCASGVMAAIVDEDYYTQGTISTYDVSRILPTPPTHPQRVGSHTPSVWTPFTSPSSSSFPLSEPATPADTLAFTLA